MADEKRSERITVWITPKMKRRLGREAKKKGLTLSNYAGDLLTGEKLIYMADADRDHLISTRFHLFKISANHDRIAAALERLAKSRGDADPPRLDWLKEASEEVRRSLSKLDQELYVIRPFASGNKE
ncbi:MAG TPA: hypothetical protein VF543_03090 [Pyrinomonadaceae bacterium]|jgi:hypothetical protein